MDDFLWQNSKNLQTQWAQIARVQKYLQSIASVLSVCGIAYQRWFPSRFNLPVLAPTQVPPQIFLASSVSGSGRAQIYTILPSKAMLGSSPCFWTPVKCALQGLASPSAAERTSWHTPVEGGSWVTTEWTLLMGNKRQAGTSRFMPSSHTTSSDGSFWGSAVPNRPSGEVPGGQARICDSCEASTSPTPSYICFHSLISLLPSLSHPWDSSKALA